MKTYTLTLTNKGIIPLQWNIKYFNEETSLKDAQEAVEGYIENVYWPEIAEKNVVCWCNEHGKFNNLPQTLFIQGQDGQIIDDVRGNLYFDSFDENTGDSLGISIEDVKWLITHEMFEPISIINCIDCYEDFKTWFPENKTILWI